jgi:hypothetical protein
MKHRVKRLKKFSVTLGKNSKHVYKYICKRISLDEFVNDANFINHSHITYGASQSGKTLFTVLLLRTLIATDPEKYRLIILSKTEDALLKFTFVDKILGENNFDRNRIVRYDNIEDFQLFYKKISNEMKQKIENMLTNNEYTPDNIAKHYLVVIDDCAEMLKAKRNESFFDVFFANKRHANMTVIYGVQMIQNIIPSIKNNTDSVTIIGDMPHNDCSVMYSGFRQISTNFKSLKSFLAFIDSKNRIFKEYTIFTFKKLKSGEKQVLCYIINSEFVKKYEIFDKKIKNNL